MLSTVFYLNNSVEWGIENVSYITEESVDLYYDAEVPGIKVECQSFYLFKIFVFGR